MRRCLFAVFVAAVAGCAPSPERQAAALTSTAPVTAERVRESRRFDTTDRNLMLQASVGVLQDLGFTIEETQPQFGVIVASKLAGARIRAQVVLRSIEDTRAISVRVNFQRVSFAPGATLPRGDTLTDSEIYRGFFEKLSQSVFLTAHEI